MTAIAAWSNVEAALLDIVMQMTDSEDSVASTLYLSLESQSAKSSAIGSLAKLQADHEFSVRLNQALAVVKTAGKLRNPLAHWKIGASAEIPNALILQDPVKNKKGSLNYHSEAKARVKKFRSKKAWESDFFKAMSAGTMIYQKADLERIIKYIDDVCGLLIYLGIIQIAGKNGGERQEFLSRFDKQYAALAS